MIYEYTIDPALLFVWASNDRDYREFFREYGLGTPRIFSSFPKKKASKLRSYLLKLQDNQSLSGQRYNEMVLKLVETIVVRDVSDELTADWKQAAVIENQRVPFDVILSLTKMDESNHITPNNMYSENCIWTHPNQLSISRTNVSLVSALSNLLRLADSKIVIIDPYGWTVEAVCFIQFMLQSITNHRISDNFPVITLYYKEKRGSGSPSAAHIKHQIQQGLTGNSRNLQIQVFELSEANNTDVFHNRYILTEHGGVMIGHGIGVSGNQSDTDEIILIRSDIYHKKWQQFVDNNCYAIVSQA